MHIDQGAKDSFESIKLGEAAILTREHCGLSTRNSEGTMHGSTTLGSYSSTVTFIPPDLPFMGPMRTLQGNEDPISTDSKRVSNLETISAHLRYVHLDI